MKDQDSPARAPRIKWMVEPTFDDDGVQRTAGIDQFGREHGDPVPLQPPVGLNVGRTDELHTALKNLLIRERSAFRAAVEAEEFESEEDANDFLVAEDIFPPGNEPWEELHEFPAEPLPENGSRVDASQRPSNGQSGASDPAAQPTNQKSSVDSRAGQSLGSSQQRQTADSTGRQREGASSQKSDGSVDK